MRPFFTLYSDGWKRAALALLVGLALLSLVLSGCGVSSCTPSYDRVCVSDHASPREVGEAQVQLKEKAAEVHHAEESIEHQHAAEQRQAQEAAQQAREAAERPEREATERANRAYQREERSKWEAEERACKSRMAHEESEGHAPNDCEHPEPGRY